MSTAFTPDMVPVFQIMALGAFCSLCCVPAFYLAMAASRLHVLVVSSLLQLVVALATSGTFIVATGALSVKQTAIATLVGFIMSSTYLVGWQRAFVRSAP